MNGVKYWGGGGGGHVPSPISYTSMLCCAYIYTVDPRLSEHLWSPNQFNQFGKLNIRVRYVFNGKRSKFYLMHTTSAMNIIK